MRTPIPPSLGVLFILASCLALAMAACGDLEVEDPEAAYGDEFNNSNNSSNNSGEFNNSGFNNGGDNPLPGNSGNNDNTPEEPYIPEEEARFAFQAPRPSRNYVFVANTELDSVAKIDADTLEITSIETGDRPTLVQTFKEQNLAVILNEGSNEVTVIRADAGEEDADYALNLSIPPSMNALRLSPNGDFALAYFDFDRAQADPDFNLNEAAPPFQDVALIKLEKDAEEIYYLTVGFQILDLEFDEEGEKAFVITRTGVSTIDLNEADGDRSYPPVAVDDVDAEDETDREVEITGDGRFAFVRTVGLEGLNIVDLESREVTFVSLKSTPTDLDIVPGRNRALAIVRGSSEAAIIDLPEALDAPDNVRTIDLGDTNAGQAELTPDTSRAVIFTTAEERKEITVVDLDEAVPRTFALEKGVQSVAIGPRSLSAVVFHTKQPGAPLPGEPEDNFIAKSWGYSILDLNSGYSKLETVPSEPGEFAFGENNRTLFVLLNDPVNDVRQVEIINLESFRTDSLRLGSPPEHIGTIPNEGSPRVYISQEHNVGRMTFIDELSGEVKTVTGFELNSLIE